MSCLFLLSTANDMYGFFFFLKLHLFSFCTMCSNILTGLTPVPTHLDYLIPLSETCAYFCHFAREQLI